MQHIYIYVCVWKDTCITLSSLYVLYIVLLSFTSVQLWQPVSPIKFANEKRFNYITPKSPHDINYRYNLTRYCTQYYFEGKTLTRLSTPERQTYLALSGELCLSIVRYWGESDREISGVHCNNIKSASSHKPIKFVSRLYLVCTLWYQ